MREEEQIELEKGMSAEEKKWSSQKASERKKLRKAMEAKEKLRLFSRNARLRTFPRPCLQHVFARVKHGLELTEVLATLLARWLEEQIDPRRAVGVEEEFTRETEVDGGAQAPKGHVDGGPVTSSHTYPGNSL